MRRTSHALPASLMLAVCLSACVQTPIATPAVSPNHAVAQPAIDGILAAFKTHPLVAINDDHGLAQEMDFYGALVRDPRFGREVGNVVVEFGGSVRQDTIDRYVAGEDVPYAELRRVWTDTVGWTPVVPYLGYLNFFAHVRSANQALPSDQRIRVWLGEPPIDWSKVTTRADYVPLLRQRDEYPAALIQQEILARNRKALVIYGSGHLFRYPSGPPGAEPHPGTEQALRQVFADMATDQPTLGLLTPGLLANLEKAFGTRLSGMKGMVDALGPLKSMRFREADAKGDDVYLITFASSAARASIGLDAGGKAIRFNFDPLSIPMAVEATYPGVFFHVTPYAGFAGKACTQRLEEQAKAWPVPALATLRGSTLESDLEAPGCGRLPPGVAASDNPASMPDLGTLSPDALLFLGPARDLTISPGLPDMYLDADYRKEIVRRSQVMRGPRPTLEPSIQDYPVAPRRWRPDSTTTTTP